MVRTLEVFENPGVFDKPNTPVIRAKVREFGNLVQGLAKKYGEGRYYKWFEPWCFAEYFGFSPDDKAMGYKVANMLKDEFGLVVKYCRVDGMHFRWYIYTKLSWKRERTLWKNRHGIELPE